VGSSIAMITARNKHKNLRGATQSQTPVAGLEEYYATLAHNLRTQRLTAEHSRAPETGRVIGVTSCGPAAGVTSVAANLAIAAATDAAPAVPVALVDANLRRPGIASRFRLRPGKGFAEVVEGAADLDVAQNVADHPNLAVFTASGRCRTRDAFDESRLRATVEELRARYSFVVVDLPPANEPNICLALADKVDGLLLVIEAECVRRDVATRIQRRLADAGGNLLGVVYNKRRDHIPTWLYHRL
jgi:Mrp family chromosome partitioning ATPase